MKSFNGECPLNITSNTKMADSNNNHSYIQNLANYQSTTIIQPTKYPWDNSYTSSNTIRNSSKQNMPNETQEVTTGRPSTPSTKFHTKLSRKHRDVYQLPHSPINHQINLANDEDQKWKMPNVHYNQHRVNTQRYSIEVLTRNRWKLAGETNPTPKT